MCQLVRQERAPAVAVGVVGPLAKEDATADGERTCPQRQVSSIGSGIVVQTYVAEIPAKPLLEEHSQRRAEGLAARGKSLRSFPKRRAPCRPYAWA